MSDQNQAGHLGCAACRDLLDDRIDGVLPATASAAVDAHLAGCADCAAEFAALRAVVARAAALRGGVEPVPEAVWDAIAARTVARPRERWGIGPRAGFAAAAAAALVAVGAVGFLQQRPAPSAPVATVDAPVQLPRAAQRAVLVNASLGGPGMDGPTREVIARNLKVIQTALAEIETAMAANPNDPNLTRLLAEIHRQESALIERSQRIRITANRRTDI